MVFRAVLSCLVLLAFAVFAQAAVNPDEYMTPYSGLDTERIFKELAPDQVLEMARILEAREHYGDYFKVIGVLVRQARFGDLDQWDAAARNELFAFQRKLEKQCESVLAAIRQEAGKQDRDTLAKALHTVQAMRDQMGFVARAQEAWSGRALPILQRWQALDKALSGRPLSAWVARQAEVERIAKQTSQLKEDVCSATTLAAARDAFARLVKLAGQLDKMSDALSDWQAVSAFNDLSGPDKETDALAKDVDALVKDRDSLANLAQSNKVFEAIQTLEESGSTGPRMDLIDQTQAVIVVAVYNHSLASDVLSASWPDYKRQGLAKDQDWRNEMRNKLRQVLEGTDAFAGHVSTTLKMPGGRSVSVELRETLDFQPRQAMDKVSGTRDKVRNWLKAAESLERQDAFVRADVAAARDCLTTKAKDVSAQGGEDQPPVEPDTDQDGDEPGHGLDQDLDTGPDGPDGGLDGEPDGGPDGDSGDDTGDDTGGDMGGHGSGGHGQGAGGGDTDADPGWTFNNTPLLATSGGITSTGYHVFAAGTRMGWAAGLCRYSVGPADQTIVEHMNAAGAHAFEAYRNSRAPLLAWPNYKSIQADFKRKGEKLLKEAQRPGSPYRVQLASALRQKMMGLANGVAIQVVANEVKSMENCESKYHRLGFYLAYAHQVFLIAKAMEEEGADDSLIRKATADGEQKVQSAINTLVDLGKVKLASGACARLSDLRDELRKALSGPDIAMKARIAAAVWQETSLRIQGMSGDAFAYNGDPGELEGLWGKEGDTETLRFDTDDGVHYKGVSSEDGLVAELTMTAAKTYQGRFLVIVRCNGKVTSTKWVGGQRIEVNGMTATAYLRFSEKAEKPFAVIFQRVGY